MKWVTIDRVIQSTSSLFTCNSFNLETEKLFLLVSGRRHFIWVHQINKRKNGSFVR